MQRPDGEQEHRLSKPAPPHNPLKGFSVCGCVECSRKVLDLRCEAVAPGGERCGDYKRHRGSHTILLATAFLVAEERVRLDGPAPALIGSKGGSDA